MECHSFHTANNAKDNLHKQLREEINKMIAYIHMHWKLNVYDESLSIKDISIVVY